MADNISTIRLFIKKKKNLACKTEQQEQKHEKNTYFKNKQDGVQLLPVRFVPWKTNASSALNKQNS